MNKKMRHNIKIIKTIQKLETYTNTSFPILSVYIKDKRRGNLVALVQQLSASVAKQEGSVEDDIFTVITFLQVMKKITSSHNIAIFCGGGKVWEVIYHDYPIPSQCSVSHEPNLQAFLVAIKKDYRYLVVL